MYSPPTRPSRRPARRLSRSCRSGASKSKRASRRCTLDKLDGRITQEFFDKQSAAWRSEQGGLQRKIQRCPEGHAGPVDQAVDMLRLTSGASELFLQQPAAEQRPVAP